MLAIKPDHRVPKRNNILRYRQSRISESTLSESLRKTPSKVTIKEESEVFGTRLAHYGINIMTHSTPDLIPEKLPIEKVSDKIKRIPLANGNRGKLGLGRHILSRVQYSYFCKVINPE